MIPALETVDVEEITRNFERMYALAPDVGKVSFDTEGDTSTFLIATQDKVRPAAHEHPFSLKQMFARQKAIRIHEGCGKITAELGGIMTDPENPEGLLLLPKNQRRYGLYHPTADNTIRLWRADRTLWNEALDARFQEAELDREAIFDARNRLDRRIGIPSQKRLLLAAYTLSKAVAAND